MPNAAQQKYQGYIDREGNFRIFDPDIPLLPVIQQINPGFRIQSDPPPAGFVPNFQRLRSLSIPDISAGNVVCMSTAELWRIHDAVLDRDTTFETERRGTATLLDLKAELAARALQDCVLCGHACHIDRTVRRGKCGLTDDAYYESLYVHIAEEPQITPALVVKLFGCALRCKGCQAFEVLDVSKASTARKLDATLWYELSGVEGAETAVAVEFVGGDPNENLAAILWAMTFAPPDFRLPVVWNTHAYGAPVAYNLLDGVVDVYLPDFKYGNEECARRVSGIPDYVTFAKAGIEAMIKQEARIIVRLLILPGHLPCCHIPTLEWLSRFKDRLWVSVMDGYMPLWHALNDPALNRRPTKEEIDAVWNAVRRLGLREVTEHRGRFWS